MKYPWKPTFGNNQLFLPHAIFTGQTQLEWAEAWILTMQLLDNTGSDTWEHTFGFPVTLRNLVTEKIIPAQEQTQQKDTQQHQQQCLGHSGFGWLLYYLWWAHPPKLTDIIGTPRCSQSTAMCVSKQHDRVALVMADNQALIGAHLTSMLDGIGFKETQKYLLQCQEVLFQVARYTEPAETVQRVCNPPAKIIMSQKEITDFKAQNCLPLTYSHLEMDERTPSFENGLTEARTMAAADGTSEELHVDLIVKTQDTQESEEEVRNLWTQLVNALTLAVWVALAAPQGLEDKGPIFPDSTDFSGSDWTEGRGRIAHLWMVIQIEPSCIPHKQLNILYESNRLWRGALVQILAHIREEWMIGLGDQPAFVQVLEAAIGYPDKVATAERNFREIQQQWHKISQD